MRDKNNTLGATGEVPLEVDLKLQSGPAYPEPAAPDKLGFGLHGELTADRAWRQACRWRLARILRFIDRQKKQRAWISFSELAERYGRNIGIDEGYKQLQQSVINGKFERNSRSRVLYLHPATTTTKMTREKMRNAVETYPPETVRRHYLAPCWIPRELDAWCQSWNRPDDQAPKRKGGRHRCDDTVAIDEMHRLVQRGFTCRQAADQVVAQGLALGTGISKSTADRIRRKFAKSFRR
jgi:hypothetical protein